MAEICLKDVGLTWETASKQAKDRQKRRSLVEVPCATWASEGLKQTVYTSIPDNVEDAPRQQFPELRVPPAVAPRSQTVPTSGQSAVGTSDCSWVVHLPPRSQPRVLGGQEVGLRLPASSVDKYK